MTNPADPFATAAQTGPVVRCLGNDRLIVAVPLRIESQQIPAQYLNGKPPGSVSDVLVADVIAIDGGPIMFGGDPDKGVPDTQGPIMPGTPMREFRFYQTTLISQLRGHIGQGPVIGRLLYGRTKTNLPNWKLTDPRDGDKAMALGPYQAYASGQFSAPQGAPATAPAQTAPATAYAPQATAQAPASVPPVGVPGVGTPATAPPAPPAPDPTLTVTPPAGFSNEQWHSFSRPQREQLMALNGIAVPVG